MTEWQYLKAGAALAPGGSAGWARAAGLLASALVTQAFAESAAPSDAPERRKDEPAPRSSAPPAEAGTLEKVTVHAETPPETAWSPVKGFVATRSAAGSKTDTPLLETPQTINVVTRDEIAVRAAQNISQAAAYSPGLITEAYGPSTRDDYFYVRGFEAAQFLDGTRLMGANYGNLRIEPYAVERFEILRGPSSMLYGQSPPGGLINMVSKRPLSVPFHEIQLLGGSFNRIQGSLDLSGPVDRDGRLLYRLTALGRGSDTQVDHAEDDRYFVAPSFTWQPSEDTHFTFLSHYQKDEAGNVMQFLPPEGSRLFNPNGKISTGRFLGEPGYDRYRREQFSLGYAFDHRFNETWSVRQNLRYADVRSDYPVIFPLGFATDLAGNVIDYRTITRLAGLYRDQAGTFTLDNQAQADFATGPVQHTVLLGVDYRFLSGDRQRGFADVPNIDLYSPVYGQPFARPIIDYLVHQERDQVGIYTQDQIRWDHWLATVGVRYDWTGADTLEDDRFFGTVTKTRQDDEAFTYRTGLSYLFDSGFAPYFSYSESFDPVAGTDFFGTPFKPTTGQQYEFGLKYQPSGYNALITLSFFHLTQQNVVTADPNPIHIGYSVQTGEARSRGIELEGKASLAEGLNLTAAYSYVQAETTKTNEANQLGKNLPYTPEHQGSAWLDYTFQQGSLAGFGLGGGVRYLGPNYGDLSNSLSTPSYTLFDATVHYDLGQVHPGLKGARLGVNLSNAFDREYFTTCGDGSCYYGNRRTVLASLRYNW